jgi:uncharacterized protein (UPF0297 family)
MTRNPARQPEPRGNFMKFVYLTLNWIFGILFLLTGMMMLLAAPIAGIVLLFISFFIFPPIRNFAYSKTGKQIPIKIRGATIFILFIVFSFFVNEYQKTENKAKEAALAKVQAEKAIAVQQQNIDYFNQNSMQILGQVRESIAKSDFNSAISLSSRYLMSKNPELISLNEEAKTKQRAVARENLIQQRAADREQKTQAILAQLKGVSANELRKNIDLYQQLVSLNPDIPAYTNKLKEFSEKLKQQEEKERVAQEKIKIEEERRLLLFGKPPTQSKWDGSYYPVEKYLQKIANDPDSIKIDSCTGVYITKNGWVVGCDYRGRNAFGGMIRQSNWFTIVHDRVIKMDNATAFKP